MELLDILTQYTEFKTKTSSDQNATETYQTFLKIQPSPVLQIFSFLMGLFFSERKIYLTNFLYILDTKGSPSAMFQGKKNRQSVPLGHPAN